MRIAFVSNVCYPFITGGAEKRIYEIGTRLADEGHDITLYARHYWDGPKVMEFEGMTLHAVSPERELYTGDDGERSITEALEFAKDVIHPLRNNLNEHDIVVASVFPYFPVLAAKLATLGTGTPLISTWHEVWGDYWNDYLGYLAPFGKTVEHLTARCPQYPIAVSEMTGEKLTQIGPSEDRIRVVPNGIDYNEIRETVPAENGFDVLFAGRLIEDKRVDLLLEAFDRVSTENTTLGIIGDGPMAEELEAQAAGLASSDRITFLGFLEEYEEVLAQMRAADIFAAPSTREGFGLTYAEAMAAGCTVIAADHPESAADEVIDDAGFLAEPTVDGVAHMLQRALEGECPPTDPVERASVFSWDQIAEDALCVYHDALNGSW